MNIGIKAQGVQVRYSPDTLPLPLHPPLAIVLETCKVAAPGLAPQCPDQ